MFCHAAPPLLALALSSRCGPSVTMNMRFSMDDGDSYQGETLLEDLKSFFGDDPESASSNIVPLYDPLNSLQDPFTITVRESSPPPKPPPPPANFLLEMRRRQRADSSSVKGSHKRPLVSGGVRPQTAPVFTTTVHDESDGFFECDLISDEDGHTVGRVAFINESPTEVATALQKVLGGRTAELQHLDVSEHVRGHDGGRILVRAMADVLRGVGCEYVLLEHLDRGGGGKLIQFCECARSLPHASLLSPPLTLCVRVCCVSADETMGFQKARGFDALVEDRELDRSLSEKHMIVPLKQLCSALSE